MSVNHSLTTGHCCLTGNRGLCRNDALCWIQIILKLGLELCSLLYVLHQKCSPPHFFIRTYLFKPPFSQEKKRLLRVSNIYNKVIKLFHLDYSEEDNDAVETKKKKKPRYYTESLLKSESYHVYAYSLFFFLFLLNVIAVMVLLL